MTTEATPGNAPLSDQLGPVAEVKCGRLQWAIPRDDYRLPLRFLNNDTRPLYDQAALDAAVAAERERCARLCDDEFPRLQSSAERDLCAWLAQRIRKA